MTAEKVHATTSMKYTPPVPSKVSVSTVITTRPANSIPLERTTIDILLRAMTMFLYVFMI